MRFMCFHSPFMDGTSLCMPSAVSASRAGGEAPNESRHTPPSWAQGGGLPQRHSPADASSPAARAASAGHFTCAGGRHVATASGACPRALFARLSMDESSVIRADAGAFPARARSGRAEAGGARRRQRRTEWSPCARMPCSPSRWRIALPIFLVDPVTGAFGLVHSGWKGTGIVHAALESMMAAFGTDPRDVSVTIGPGIGPCCYRVPEERARVFLRKVRRLRRGARRRRRAPARTSAPPT